MNIGGIEVGSGQPCRFVAEISNNHNGDRDRCGRLIDAAKAAGADFVKLQCYSPDELVALRGDGPAPEPWGSQGWSMRDLYGKARTPFDWFPKIAAHCERVGMPWFSSVFGPESLAVLESVGCPAYKIARLDSSQASLIEAVQKTGKPFLVSVGPDGNTNVRDSRGVMVHIPGEQKLFCPPGYPAEPIPLPLFWNDNFCMSYGLYEDVHYLGLSSHCLDPMYQQIAVARGARLIEMHFMLDNEPSELESNVSLTASQFREMVDTARKIEGMIA